MYIIKEDNQHVWGYCRYIAHNILLNSLDKIADQRIANYGLAQFLILNILFEIIEKNELIKDIVFNPEKYLSLTAERDKLLERLIETIILVFNHLANILKKDEDFVYKNFFKAKEKASTFRENTIAHFNTSLSLNGKTIEDLCVEAGFSV